MVVVGKVMRWSPWALATVRKRRKYKVSLRVTRIEGLPALGEEEGRVAAVEVTWRGPPRGGRLPYLGAGRRRKQPRSVSSKATVAENGTAWWAANEMEFKNVCRFSEIVDQNCSGPWEVSFSVLYGCQVSREARKEKLAEIGTITVNLAEWAWAFLSQEQGGEVEGKKSQLQVQRKQLPITLRKDSLTSDAMLHVTISFTEMNTSQEASERQGRGEVVTSGKNESQQDEETSDGQVTDISHTDDSEDLNLSQQLQLATAEDKVASYGSRKRATAGTSSSSSINNSGRSSPELQLGSASKRGFLSWGMRTKNSAKDSHDKEEGDRESQPQASSSPNNTLLDGGREKETSEAKQDEDPIGTWVNKELMSRDKQAKLRAQTFFASIDQRDESADGESACTALVAVIANALHSNGLNTPTSAEFDALIREGSSEWRRLCEDASYIARFPNKHFDLDTILEARIRPISVLSENSYIGFFQPESFESLRGAMSFDAIWDEITKDVREGHPKIYIVSWNDHFFVLKLEPEVYYIMDTLGERLYEGCDKAYMLRFDDSTEMYRLPENRENEAGDELVCSGKECCREFIKRFLAAIPLREELELEEKGKGTNNTALHQRLQIEFHLTQASNEAARDLYSIDWSFLGSCR